MKDLQFAEKLNSTQAISEAGKELLNNYRAYVYSNAPTCAVVNAFMNEAQQYSFDAGVSTISAPRFPISCSSVSLISILDIFMLMLIC
jgi:hypothetical protein